MEEWRSVFREGKLLRRGFTTGSAATAAAKGAALLLLGRGEPQVSLETPAGIRLELPLEKLRLCGRGALALVRKDGGDDADVTSGLLIGAYLEARQDGQQILQGGPGVGHYRQDSFLGKAGEPAINRVPREMLQRELSPLLPGGWRLVLFVPEGERVARQTFNPNLGIEGGISIIGSTGIVEPMSEEAFKKCIFLEIEQQKEQKEQELLLVLGNHSRALSQEERGTIKIGNFIGDSLSYAYFQGFRKLALSGHIGKMAKLSIGVFNTHSRVSDTRLEALVYHLALLGHPLELLQEINRCRSAEEAACLLYERGERELFQELKRACQRQIATYLKDPELSPRIGIFTFKHGWL